MPKKGNGKSLKRYRVSGDYSTISGHSQRFVVEILASSLVGAIGRGARVGRKEIKGKFTQATIIAETIPMIMEPTPNV